MIMAALLAGLLALLVFGGIAILQGGEHRRIRKRLAAITGQKNAARSSHASGAGGISIRRDQPDSSIAGLDGLIKRSLPRVSALRDRLTRTGKKISLGEYVLASLLVGGMSYLACIKLAGAAMPVALLLAVAVGVALPYRVISFMIAQRQNKFLALFPEGIELMVRGLKSGVPSTESMRVVGQELPDPVGAVFRDITDAMIMGQNMTEALAVASKRISITEFRFFEISLGIQQETGGNLSETLENLANTLRRRKQMKNKIRALSSEARASAYILGALPFLMFGILNLVNPDYAGVLIHDPRGHETLAAAGISLAIGVGVMIKMGQFEI